MNRRELLTGLLSTAAVAATPCAALAAGHCQIVDMMGTQYCEAGILSNIAHVSARSQYANQWCWAACIEMIFRHYGRPVQQARIVQETFGSIVNMPAQPQQILYALNRPWIDDHGRPFSAQADVMSANLMTALQDLQQDHPLVIGTLGHAMVLTAMGYAQSPYTGVQLQRLIVRDPWPGRGRRELTGQEAFNISFLARVRVG